MEVAGLCEQGGCGPLAPASYQADMSAVSWPQKGVPGLRWGPALANCCCTDTCLLPLVELGGWGWKTAGCEVGDARMGQGP